MKPELNQLNKIIALWEKQYDYHHDLDNEYYVGNNSELKLEFEKYLIKAIKNNDPNILVALENDELIGFITFEKADSDYFDTNIEEYGEIIELFVDKSYRQKGVGKKLMQAIEDHFSKLGINWIELQASTYNKSAINFYDNLGYENKQTVMFKKLK